MKKGDRIKILVGKFEGKIGIIIGEQFFISSLEGKYQERLWMVEFEDEEVEGMEPIHESLLEVI